MALNSQQPQRPRSSPGAFVDQVRQLLISLNPTQRAGFGNFWGDIRQQLNRQDEEIARLCQQVQNLTQQNDLLNQQLQAALNPVPPGSANRPRTSDSIQQQRFDMQAVLDEEFPDLGDTSVTVESIWDLDPAWVRSRLNVDRQNAAENELRKWATLGCWMGPIDNNHPYGYTKVNLRNTTHPTRQPRTMIGCQPFRHQLAVVAAGLGQNLLRTSGKMATDDVSHLCHNHRCFNPDHVIVESKGMNQRRGTCVGQWIVKFRGSGTIYNPCVHDGEEHRRGCLLPRMELLNGQSYYQNSGSGPILR
jgi:hypothetical protein